MVELRPVLFDEHRRECTRDREPAVRARTMARGSLARRLGLAAALATALVSCEDQGARADLAREVAQAREELAAQRARIDGIVDRLDRIESLVARDDGGDATALPPPPGLDALASQSAAPSSAGAAALEAPRLIVSVARRSISVGDDKVDSSGLIDRFSAHVAKSPQATVVLRVASGVSSGRLNEISDMAREQGITQIAVVREGTAKKQKKRKKRSR